LLRSGASDADAGFTVAQCYSQVIASIGHSCNVADNSSKQAKRRGTGC
jgi:hypothetical protein